MKNIRFFSENEKLTSEQLRTILGGSNGANPTSGQAKATEVDPRT